MKPWPDTLSRFRKYVNSKDLTFIKEGVFEGATEDPGDLDGVQVGGLARLLDPEDGVDGHLGEEVLVLAEDLGGERRLGDVDEVLAELVGVLAVVGGGVHQGLPRHLGGHTPS